MVRENDYTGTPIEDGDQLSMLEDLGLYEFDADKDTIDFYVDDGNEAVIHVGSAANGAKSLREAAERLYDFAEELLAMSGEGWELVDDITQGHGTAVRFDADETNESETDNG